MVAQNMSDDIEAFLKQVLQARSFVEIRRTELAKQFKVVPSQINYVIKTRFGLQQGYQVESKRGGGGYIRIEQVALRDDVVALQKMLDDLGDELSYARANDILMTLLREDLLAQREALLIRTLISKEALAGHAGITDGRLRVQLIRQLLHRLCLESEGEING